MRWLLILAVLLLLPASTAMAQDPVKVDSQHYKVMFENDHVRVLRISYGPHEKSVMHEHPAGVVVVLSDDQRWLMTLPDGTTEERPLGKAGETFWAEAEEHLPENPTDERQEVILVELKSQAEGEMGAMAEGEDEMGAVAKTDDEEMNEAMTEAMTAAEAVKTGTFRDGESRHHGSGRATIYRIEDGSHVLRLEDFRVTNGPDLRVLLSSHPDPENPHDVKDQGYLELGKLKGNRGNQNYEIPAGVDINGQQSVVIYCKPFSVVFSVASLS